MQTRKVVNLKLLQARSLQHTVSLRAIYAAHWVFSVVSGTTGQQYDVTLRKSLTGATCTCKWSSERNGEICAHIMAAMRKLAAMKKRQVSFWDDERLAERQHRKVTPFGRFFITSRAG